MFQRFVAISLIIFTLSASFSRLFVFAGFQFNQKYIASTLCENRDKPWLHCNGKCYLMKKIKAAEEKEKAGERENQKNLFQETFTGASTSFKFHSALLQTICTPYQIVMPPVAAKSLFRPPQFC